MCFAVLFWHWFGAFDVLLHHSLELLCHRYALLVNEHWLSFYKHLLGVSPFDGLQHAKRIRTFLTLFLLPLPNSISMRDFHWPRGRRIRRLSLSACISRNWLGFMWLAFLKLIGALRTEAFPSYAFAMFCFLF